MNVQLPYRVHVLVHWIDCTHERNELLLQHRITQEVYSMILLKGRKNGGQIDLLTAVKPSKLIRVENTKVRSLVIPLNTLLNPVEQLPILRIVGSPADIPGILDKSASIRGAWHWHPARQNAWKSSNGLEVRRFIFWWEKTWDDQERRAHVYQKQNYKDGRNLHP